MKRATSFGVPRGRSSGLIDRWLDGAGSDNATFVFLLLFVVLWTAFQIISFSSIDLHPDLVEVYGWSRHPSFGYAKHPPMAGWIGAAWFAIFPAQDWAFHLLAMTNSAVAFFAVDRIARRYLSGDKRILVLLLLLLTPFYQFHGQRFSTNQVLLSTWPIATYCFLRAFQDRTFGWSFCAGVAAAAAMLGKYYSIFLIGSFAVAVLVHPARRSYLTSKSFIVSIAAGFLVLLPHIVWLLSTGKQTFAYATALHTTTSLAEVLRKDALYLIGSIAYVALVLFVYAIAVRPDRATLRATIWPTNPDRQMLVVLLAGQILLPFLAAPFLGAILTPLWSMSAWFLLPIVLLAPESALLSRTAVVRIAAMVLAITVAVLLAAPAVAWRNHVNGPRDYRSHVKLASEELARLWRNETTAPLKIVFGDIGIGSGATFYLPSHPDAIFNFTLHETPWITPDDLSRYGWAGLCAATDRGCADRLNARLSAEPGARRSEATLVSSFFGYPGTTQSFVFAVVPPREGAPRSP